MARAPKNDAPEANAKPTRKAPPAPRSDKPAKAAKPRPPKATPAKGPRPEAPVADPQARPLWRRLLPSPLTLLVVAALSAAAWLSLDVVSFPLDTVAPDLQSGDLVLVDRVTPELDHIARPRVAVVRHDEERSRDVLALIVAWDGQQVEYRDDAILVDGEAFELPAPLAPAPRVADAPAGGGLAVHFAATQKLPPAPGARRLKRRPRSAGMPANAFDVPRHHAFVLVTDEDHPERLRGRLIPQGDITGAARIVLTNTTSPRTWTTRLLRPIRGLAPQASLASK